MATYVMTGQTAYGGPWAATLAECTQNAGNFRPAKAKFLADQILAGTIVAGDRVLLDASIGGPLKLIDAQDWVANTVGATVGIASDTLNMPSATGARGRNIIFGDIMRNNVSQSKASGIAFHATGTDGWNVDMTGIQAAGSINNRQMAAILIQGQDLDVTGWRIKCGDWNPIATGRIAPPSATSYPDSVSMENCGLMIRGAWGSRIYGNVVEGSDWTARAIDVQYGCLNADLTLNANKTLLVYNNTATRAGRDCMSVFSAWGTSQEDMPNGVLIDVYGNTIADGYFAASGGNNSALFHGNLFSISAKVMSGGGRRVRVRNNTLYGNCQDAIVLRGSGIECYENNIYSLCPGFTGQQAITPLWGKNSGGTTASGFATGWDYYAFNVEGNGIKMGLGGYDGVGTNGGGGSGGSEWMGIGVVGAGTAFGVDECRHLVYRNRVIDVTGYTLTTNGSGGMFIHANECDNSSRGGGTNHCMAVSSLFSVGNHWISNNYLKGPSTGLLVGNFNRVYLHNNAIDSPNFIGQIGATSTSVFGSNNVTRSAAWTGTTANVFTTGGTVATPAYTIGTGPTASGNCDGAGGWHGVYGSRTNQAMRDLTGYRWRNGRIPVGPRQP